LASTATVGFAPAAFAVTTFTTCSTVSASIALSPPITSTPQTVTSDFAGSTVSGCAPGVITSANISGTMSGKASCTPQPAGTILSTGTLTFSWNDGSTSTVKAKTKATSNVVAQILSGTITAGKFAGTAANPTKLKVTLQEDGITGDCTAGISHVHEHNTTPLTVKSAH
jgi:hypothetical protein